MRQARLAARRELKHTVRERHALIRWNDEYAIGTHRHPLPRLGDLHAGRFRKQIGQFALVFWIEMLHQQERHPRVRRQLFQQCRESFQPARRSSDTYDWKSTDISSGNRRSFCFLAASWHTLTITLYARSLITSVH